MSDSRDAFSVTVFTKNTEKKKKTKKNEPSSEESIGRLAFGRKRTKISRDDVDIQLVRLDENGKTECEGNDDDTSSSSSSSDASKPERTLRRCLCDFPTSFKYAFRHPVSRLIVASCVLILNVLLYVEDPTSYSEKEVTVYGGGRVFNYFFRQYPLAEDGSWIFWKIASLAIWITIGCLMGKYVIHNVFLRDCLRLGLFKKQRGSFVIMFFTAMFTAFLGSFLYNTIIFKFYRPGRGSSSSYVNNTAYVLNDNLGVEEVEFGKITVFVTLFADYVTLFAISDVMVQMATDAENGVNDKWTVSYGRFFGKCCVKGGRGWNRVRVPLFWVTFVLFLLAITFSMISNYVYAWTSYTKGLFGSDEMTRCFLCSFLICLDVTIFMQDWGFPTFEDGDSKVKIMGCRGSKIGCSSGKLGCDVKFTSKWINYGSLILILLLDTSMYANQVFYEPSNYLQITDSEDYVRKVYNPLPPSYANPASSSNGNATSRFYEGIGENGTFLLYDANNYDYDNREFKSYFYKYGVMCKKGSSEEYPFHNASPDVIERCYNVSERINVKYVGSYGLTKYLSALPVLSIYAILAFCTCWSSCRRKRSCDLQTVCANGCGITDREEDDDDDTCCERYSRWCCGDDPEEDVWGAKGKKHYTIL